jgi:hypothetical protein
VSLKAHSKRIIKSEKKTNINHPIKVKSSDSGIGNKSNNVLLSKPLSSNSTITTATTTTTTTNNNSNNNNNNNNNNNKNNIIRSSSTITTVTTTTATTNNKNRNNNNNEKKENLNPLNKTNENNRYYNYRLSTTEIALIGHIKKFSFSDIIISTYVEIANEIIYESNIDKNKFNISLQLHTILCGTVKKAIDSNFFDFLILSLNKSRYDNNENVSSIALSLTFVETLINGKLSKDFINDIMNYKSKSKSLKLSFMHRVSSGKEV